VDRVAAELTDLHRRALARDALDGIR